MAIQKDMTACAACGKEGNSDDMNTCNKCKMVKYCNAACKKKHRTKHKKKCDRRVAELHDEQLFKEIELEECPICMLTLPIKANQTLFKTCCGKTICMGCIYAIQMSEGKDLCPYCRTPPATSEKEIIERVENLMDKGNGEAFHVFAGYYAYGSRGLPQDWAKANELLVKAGELGCATGYYNLGQFYRLGIGVEINKKKANHYYELAAMMGNVHARHALGLLEYVAGNYDRALKHLILAAKAGFEESLHAVKKGFMEGLFTKDEYESTLRAHHKRQKEMKSDERDKAAASERRIRNEN